MKETNINIIVATYDKNLKTELELRYRYCERMLYYFIYLQGDTRLDAHYKKIGTQLSKYHF